MRTSRQKKPIRVCHIIAKMVYGGASIGTLNLIEMLDPGHFDSTIICGFQSEREGNLFDYIRKKKLKFLVVPELVRELNPIKDSMAMFKLISIMRQHKYDIVHTHGSKAGVIGRLAAAFCRAPVILHTVHGWGLKAGGLLGRTIFRLIERMLAGITTAILFQTKSDMKEASTYRIGRDIKYQLVGNGIMLRPFVSYDKRAAEYKRKQLGLVDYRIIGTVGRVSAQKNPVGFLHIAEAVLSRRQDVKFVFVGGGELLEQMRDYVKEHNLGQKVIFTGVESNIPEVVANFDIFILPSLWEGLPRSLLEAMALSKPVVVSRIGGIDEVITDGDNGFIADAQQVDGFANKILFLLEHPREHAALSTKARRTAEDYDFEKVVRKTESIYRMLVST